MNPGETITLRNDRGPLSIAVALAKGAAVLFGLWIAWRAGPGGEGLVLGVSLAAMGSIFGTIDLLHLIDSDPQVTLSPQGITDHRARHRATLGWDQVGSLGYITAPFGGWTLLLFPPGAGKPVHLRGNFLDLRARDLVALIRRFAPHAEVRPKYRLWLG